MAGNDREDDHREDYTDDQEDQEDRWQRHAYGGSYAHRTVCRKSPTPDAVNEGADCRDQRDEKRIGIHASNSASSKDPTKPITKTTSRTIDVIPRTSDVIAQRCAASAPLGGRDGAVGLNGPSMARIMSDLRPVQTLHQLSSPAGRLRPWAPG